MEGTDGGSPRPTRIRWVVCALLFAATTINYVDRQVIGLLKPLLQSRLGWTDADYGDITFFFQLGYALSYAASGWFVDRVGARLGLTASVLVWSAASAAHAVVRSVAGFSAARFALGVGEGGNFPAAIRTVAQWFPAKDRALATGVFNAGSNVGAIAAPLLVPVLTVTLGWPSAFVATGALGLLWVLFWLRLFDVPERHRGVDAAELALIRDGRSAMPPAAPLPWRTVLRLRGTIAFAAADFLVGPVWWFYLFWVPDFLHRQYGLRLLALGPPLVAIYLLSDVGSIAGGALSSSLIRRGMRPLLARQLALLVCAFLVLPVVLVPHLPHLWPATLLIALAAAAHQGFSANLYTLVSDTVPEGAVASAVGIGGMAASIGGMFVAEAAGHVLAATGSYDALLPVRAGGLSPRDRADPAARRRPRQETAGARRRAAGLNGLQSVGGEMRSRSAAWSASRRPSGP